ncbi:MAG TPA: hypothetical protein VKU40_07735 [Thermoanaerobaculia bacterium]|nr:hypothetical protein [Thermoanaerobaculia bacterium]
MPEAPPLPAPRPEPPPEEAREPGWTAPIVTLLRHPGAVPPAGRLLALVVAGCALYGLAAGCFQGGEQVLWSALKAPLVVIVALLLCIPSFVVFHLIAGNRASTRELARSVVAFAAVTALLLAALAPIGWLFSAASASLFFVVFFHLAIWGVALGFGLRHLYAANAQKEARGVSFLWSVLFWFVAVQLASYLGPMLVHEPGTPHFPFEKGSFVERIGDAADHDDRAWRQKVAAEVEAEPPAAQPEDDLPAIGRPNR